MTVNDEYQRLGLTKPSDNGAAGGSTGGNQGAGGTGDQGGSGGDGGDQGDAGAGDAGGDGNQGGAGDQGGQGTGGDQGAPGPVQLTPEQILAEIQKYNPEITSLDQLKKQDSPENQEAAKIKKHNDMLAWALTTGKVNTTKYDSFKVDNAKESRQIVYEEFAKKRKGASEETINREFSKLYPTLELAQDATPDEEAEFTTLSALQNEEFENKKKSILKQRYPEMLTLEREYDAHIEQTAKSVQNTQQLTKAVNTYTADINQIISGVKPLEFSVDGEVIPFTFKPEVLEKVKGEFLQDTAIDKFIENYDKGVVHDAILFRLQADQFQNIIEYVAKKYSSAQLEKKKIGRNNLNPTEPGGGSTGSFVDTEARRRVGAFVNEGAEA